MDPNKGNKFNELLTLLDKDGKQMKPDQKIKDGLGDDNIL